MKPSVPATAPVHLDPETIALTGGSQPHTNIQLVLAIRSGSPAGA
jgi:microcystin-dependent protein